MNEQNLVVSLARFLKGCMAREGLDVRGLAAKAGVAVGTMSDLLHAKGNPTIGTIERVVIALGGRLKATVADGHHV